MKLQIKDNNIEVIIDTLGGEVTSIKSKKNQKEYLWQGAPGYWPGKSPLLFPIVGHLQDGVIGIRGEKCKMSNHGFLQNLDMEVVKHTEKELELSVLYNEETLSQYPFRFGFTVLYRIIEGSLDIQYRIENLDIDTMVYNFGLHPGFNCNVNEGESIDNYYIEFPEEKTLDTVLFNDDIRVDMNQKKRIVEESKYLYFTNEMFQRTLIFNEIDFHDIWLCHREQGRFLKLSYEGFSTLALYRNVDAPFVCLEPWIGNSAIVQDFDDLEENPTSQFLASGECKEYHLLIEI